MMKLLFENKRYIISTFLTILMVFGTSMSSYANNVPVFTEGARAIRSIAENTAAGTNIGDPVAATDADGDVLTYTKGGVDGIAFGIDSATGQIRTKAPLDYETQDVYSFSVFANDGNGGRVVILVTIHVTDVDETPANNAPVFTEGSSATRTIEENTAASTNIGTPVAATDADSSDTLTYTLGGTDAASFRIVRTSGQLQTRVALDYETKTSYSLTVSVSDGNDGSASIDVAISVTDVNETPRFPTETATLSVAENTVSGEAIGEPFEATDPDSGDTLTYSLHRGDATAFRIDPNTGQLRTKAALDFETKNVYNDLAIRATDSEGNFDAIFITITVTNVNEAPSFPTETDRRAVAENTASDTNIGDPFQATDPDSGDTLIYSLHRGDAASFRIDPRTGQLRTKAALDFETKQVYNNLAIRATDSEGNFDAIFVTITVTDVDETPRFPTETATLSVAENTASDTDIGDPFEATDPDSGDTLIYSLHRGDAAAFRIDPNTGQLRTKAALDFETKQVYTDLAIRATDSEGNFDAIFVTITVTNVNDAPVFTDSSSTTRAIEENTASGTNIGAAFAATDADSGDTLTYTLGGDDASSFSIISTTGQLQTRAALDYETDDSYSVTVIVSDDNGGSASIDVTIRVKDVNETPSFATETAILSIAENTASDTDIGDPFEATDPDNGDTLTYSLSGDDASSFSIVRTSGQLQTRAALDYETDDSYAVTVSVSDGNGESDSIEVAISVTDVNEAPSFTAERITLTVAENTVADTNIGDPFQATDPDSGDTLTYSLTRGDRYSFRIDANTGQLRTKAALDFETKNVYNDLAIRATDSEGNFDAIFITITVTNVNEAPSFATETATLSVAENTAANTNIGDPFEATDPDSGDTLIYSLHRGDAASFRIDPNTGQLQTKAALDFETKQVYNDLAIRATDSEGNFDATFITINVTNVNEAPVFTEGSSTTRAIEENTAAGTNIGTPVAATDVDSGDTLIYTLGGDDASLFSIVSTSGQLQTNVALDYETKSSYAVTVSVSDDNGGRASIDVSIRVTDVNENRAPVFSDGDSTTRTVAENMRSGQDIGPAVSATDADNDTLTYSLSGADASSFSIVRTSGQLQTRAALDYETDDSYSVTVSVSDDDGGSDSIEVTISVTDVNEAPSFATERITLTVAENTASDTDIGDPFEATDPDSGDTLIYSLHRGDASSFRIDPNTGQLRTKTALDFETKQVYKDLAIRATDSEGNFKAIFVTITVTNVNEAPTFTDGSSATRSVAENTASGENIGEAVSATDVDSGDTLTYTLSGADASSFSIVSTSGQLQTNAALDYETKSSYAVTVSVSDDNGGRASIDVSIRVTDVPENRVPVFADGDSTTRTVAENTAAGENIGRAVAATDADSGDTLAYTLGGTDASSFSIVSTSGQLQTRAALDYETKNAYSVTVTVSDSNGGSDSITVAISVTDVTEITPVNQRTQWVQKAIVAAVPGVNNADDVTAEHLAAITSLSLASSPIYALKTGDFSGLTGLTTLLLNSTQISDISPLSELTTLRTLSLSENRISDISALSGMTQLRTLNLEHARISDISALSGMTAMDALYLYNNDISDISALSGMTAISSLYLHNNDISDISALSGLTSMDILRLENNNISDISALSGLTAIYSLYLHNNDISDISALSGMTAMVTLAIRNNPILHSQYSTLRTLKRDHSLSTLDIDLNNNPPVFTEGSSTTRFAAGNMIPGRNIGVPVAATDADDDTLIYSLSGTDADSFIVVRTSGQLLSNAALDFETKPSYTVAVDASDGNGGFSRIIVTINATFVLLRGRTPQVLEAIVDAVPDVDNPYNVSEADLAAITSLDLSDLSEPITSLQSGDFAGLTGLTYISLWNNKLTSLPSGIFDENTELTDLDLEDNELTSLPSGIFDKNTGLTYISLWNNKLTSLPSGIFDKNTKLLELALQVNGSTSLPSGIFDKNTKLTDIQLGGLTSLPSGIFDKNTELTKIQIRNSKLTSLPSGIFDENTELKTLNLKDNDISDVSELEGLTSLTRLYLRGNPISDYGPLRRLKAAIEAIDNHPGISIDIDINNNIPVFTDGDSTTRSIPENTVSGTDIGTAVAATDADTNDTLTYTLGGTDAELFSIVNTSGQLQTKTALDYETEASYTVTIDVSDGNDGLDRITVTINVTDVAGAAPSVELPPEIPVNTALLTNFPNPFNPETWIPYQLATPTDVTLTIYDIRGVVVRELKLGHQAAGVYHSRSRAIHWDGRNMFGEKVATGIYFYTLKAGDYAATRKLLIRK